MLFLDHSLKYLGNKYDVQDVLQFYAYVQGGIHLDKGREKYQPLRDAFQAFKLNGLSSLDHSMRGILQVVAGKVKGNLPK